jgi:hypothetical protein
MASPGFTAALAGRLRANECGARFIGAKADLVAKAAQLMGLKVYKAGSPDVAAVAKKLPVGQRIGL